jgi:uncharacterized surface protein with fasciclin (FAS1) repeats
VTGNPTTLADVFSYHVVPGNFSNALTTYPNVTLGQTLYNDPLTVHLEGNRPQVVAWATRSDGKTHVLNQRNDSTVVNTTTIGNLTVFIVDHVLQVPENLQDTVPTDTEALDQFESILQSATLSFYNATTNQTSDVSFFDAFNTGFHGFTLFAPNNSAITAANSTLQSISGNRTALNAVLFNHVCYLTSHIMLQCLTPFPMQVINGSTLYTPLLAGSQNYTTAGGETLSFKLNATGQYVTIGNITALITQPDVLLPNGVVHIIDTVLADTDSNPSAASSAYVPLLTRLCSYNCLHCRLQTLLSDLGRHRLAGVPDRAHRCLAHLHADAPDERRGQQR